MRLYKSYVSELSISVFAKNLYHILLFLGILSLFCAKAGAKKVYAVEASGMANLISQIAEDNGYKDVIHVIHSKVSMKL